MDGARLKQKCICKCFIKSISSILAYVQKRNTAQGGTFKTFYMLPSTHACTEEGLPCAFLKIKTILKKSLDEEEIATVMEIAEVIERGRKDKLPALKNVPKKN